MAREGDNLKDTDMSRRVSGLSYILKLKAVLFTHFQYASRFKLRLSPACASASEKCASCKGSVTKSF